MDEAVLRVLMSWLMVSWLFVAGGLLPTDHIEGREPAYAGRRVTKARVPFGSSWTGGTRDTGTSGLPAFPILAIPSDARFPSWTWGWRLKSTRLIQYFQIPRCCYFYTSGQNMKLLSVRHASITLCPAVVPYGDTKETICVSLRTPMLVIKLRA